MDITCILILMNCCREVLANVYAKQLYDELLIRTTYEPKIRPVRNETEVVDVKIGLKLSQLVDVVRS